MSPSLVWQASPPRGESPVGGMGRANRSASFEQVQRAALEGDGGEIRATRSYDDIQQLAATPPMVGLVSTEMNSPPDSE